MLQWHEKVACSSSQTACKGAAGAQEGVGPGEDGGGVHMHARVGYKGGMRMRNRASCMQGS